MLYYTLWVETYYKQTAQSSLSEQLIVLQEAKTGGMLHTHQARRKIHNVPKGCTLNQSVHLDIQLRPHANSTTSEL